jgi:hypothetical protein
MKPGQASFHTLIASLTIPAQSGNDTVWKLKYARRENYGSIRLFPRLNSNRNTASHREDLSIF